MKAVILAGGLGTRLGEETMVRPKPMVEIGDKPILWHIMKIYSHFGINDFIICLGYKGYVIKEFFANYRLHCSNVTFDMRRNFAEVHDSSAEPWTVTLVDTGSETETGGRLKRVREYLGDETFCLTYGDGVADLDISKVIEFHKKSGKLATMTVTSPPGRFGAVTISKNGEVEKFTEKPTDEESWINVGFFVLEPEVLKHIDGDGTALEIGPLPRLANINQLNAWRHRGFWLPMDTLRDRIRLQTLWNEGRAPWKLWQN